MGLVFTAELWNLIISGKGLLLQIFLNSRQFASETASIFQLRLGSDPLVPWWGAVRFWFRCTWRSEFSPLGTLWLPDLRSWVVVSKRKLRILVKKKMETFGTGSAGIV